MECTRGLVWLLAGILAGCGLGAKTELPTPPRTSTAQATAERPAAPARRGSREELLGRLRAPLSRATHDLVWRPRADGGRGLHLDGRHQHAIVAHVDGEGVLRASCVENVEAAAAALVAAERAP